MKQRLVRLAMSAGICLTLLIAGALAYWTERLEAELSLPLRQPFTLWVEGLETGSEDVSLEEAYLEALPPAEARADQSLAEAGEEAERGAEGEHFNPPEDAHRPPDDASAPGEAEAEDSAGGALPSPAAPAFERTSPAAPGGEAD